MGYFPKDVRKIIFGLFHAIRLVISHYGMKLQHFLRATGIPGISWALFKRLFFIVLVNLWIFALVMKWLRLHLNIPCIYNTCFFSLFIFLTKVVPLSYIRKLYDYWYCTNCVFFRINFKFLHNLLLRRYLRVFVNVNNVIWDDILSEKIMMINKQI